MCAVSVVTRSHFSVYKLQEYRYVSILRRMGFINIMIESSRTIKWWKFYSKWNLNYNRRNEFQVYRNSFHTFGGKWHVPVGFIFLTFEYSLEHALIQLLNLRCVNLSSPPPIHGRIVIMEAFSCPGNGCKINAHIQCVCNHHSCVVISLLNIMSWSRVRNGVRYVFLRNHPMNYLMLTSNPTNRKLW